MQAGGGTVCWCRELVGAVADTRQAGGAIVAGRQVPRVGDTTSAGKQVLCDILRSGGLPGKENGNQPALFFAADDLEYQAAFPSERLGMGAFRLALECIFNRINHNPLEYTSFGKPNPFVFKNAEAILKCLRSNILGNHPSKNVGDAEDSAFNTIYMIGDNPSVDIIGAKKVVDTAEEAIDYILRREST